MAHITKTTASAPYQTTQTARDVGLSERIGRAAAERIQAPGSTQSKRSFSEAFVSASTPEPRPLAKQQEEIQIEFVHGTKDHISTYAEYIDEAESDIIIASWNLNIIPREIFISLMKAKERGVAISFIVESIKREETLECFKDKAFRYFKTNSHAKFLFVDSRILILGSFNALGDAREESVDASVLIKGTEKQLWPFYMCMYETYISNEEESATEVFGPIAAMNRDLYPRERRLLQRRVQDGSQIFLLRTIKEHEDFLVQAIPYNGHVTIYSPFSMKDNTLKRLKTLDKILPVTSKVSLKVLHKYRKGLLNLLEKVPQLKNRATVESASFHQKVIVLGTETICIGSLNWLSAAQDSSDVYSNVEFSIVLQGPQASAIIEKFK